MCGSRGGGGGLTGSLDLPLENMGLVWYLIVLITNLCRLSFYRNKHLGPPPSKKLDPPLENKFLDRPMFLAVTSEFNSISLNFNPYSPHPPHYYFLFENVVCFLHLLDVFKCTSRLYFIMEGKNMNPDQTAPRAV